MMALFSGLYEQYEGKVCVNDLSLEYINLEKFRGMVGDFLTLQQIFHGTLLENICMGRDYVKSQLEEIIELVGLKDFVYQLPLGLETELQPEGKGLSKTIAHQILLARGLVGSPKALIMEDIFNEVDPSVKAKVMDYVMNGSWTLLLVSNEQTIQQLADEIIFMDQGKLIFKGKYDDYLTYNNK